MDSSILILMKNSNKQKPTFIQDQKRLKVKEVLQVEGGASNLRLA